MDLRQYIEHATPYASIVPKRRFIENFDNGSESDTQVFVEIKVEYSRIKDVDTQGQQFKAEVFLQAKWQEPLIQNLTDDELDNFDHRCYWEPQLTLNNLMVSQKDEAFYYPFISSPGYSNPIIIMHRKIQGTFFEHLELKDFPVDVQELTLRVISSRPSTEIELIPDRFQMSTVNIASFLDADEFHIYQHVNTEPGFCKIKHGGVDRRMPYIDFKCHVKRKPGFFFWNILFIMFLITSLMFTSFALKSTDLASRLKVTVTLLLTCVTFKFTVKQSLPQISYLTYLDKYIICGLVLMAVTAILHAIIALNAEKSPELGIILNEACFYSLIIAYVVFHFIFYALLIYVSLKGRSQLKDYEIQYLRMKNIMELGLSTANVNPGFNTREKFT